MCDDKRSEVSATFGTNKADREERTSIEKDKTNQMECL